MATATKRKKPAKKQVADVLVLRTCNADMSSHNGFKWPRRGKVECPDWDAKPECGHGLHGLLWGDGDGSLLNWNNDAVWLVVAVPEDEIVEINRKVKFPRGRVVFCGDRTAATDYILSHGAAARQKPVAGCSLRGGYRSTLTGGDCSTLNWKIWDGKYYRIHTVYVGENGIKPNVPYRWIDGKAVEVVP